MCGVDKVCWLPNHGAINPPSPFRLGLLSDAAAETNPELSHSEVEEEATQFPLSSDVSFSRCLPVQRDQGHKHKRKLMTDIQVFLGQAANTASTQQAQR